ncbi:hemicentin-1 [Nematostella vectensis]|uniref:hemicentin-1 n=1 Tax=Nematostella vectensis TaxID=45351 RepID=UPI0020777F57|nr:hemicentin-1 [Nematostella vectensis]
MSCGATNVSWVLLGLLAIAFFGGTDSFSFTSEPSNPTYLTKGTVGNLTWEYAAGTGETVHDRILFQKNNVKMGYVDKTEAGITRNIYELYRGSYDIASSFNPVTLIFKSPIDSATHDGEYAVDIQIEETGEQVVSRAAINVIDPPTVTISNAKVSAVTGSTAVLTANFSVPSEVSHEKKWTFQVQGSSSSREVGQGDSLHLPNVRSNQTGNYTITVSNQYGGRASATVELQVNSLPTTTLTASNASACVNATVTLTCSATGYPAASEFVLYLGSHELEQNSNGSFSVILKTPGSAEYKCSAKNEYGASVNASVTITAKEPVSITDFPASILVANGSMATLNCSASGDGAINITITKQGSSQAWGGGVVTFSPVSAADQAWYTCTAREGASECPAVTKHAVVMVTGLPAPNTSLNVTSPTTCLGDVMELKCASTALSVEQYILEASGMGQMTSLTGDFRVTLTEPGNKAYRCHPFVRGIKLPNATVVVNVPDVMASSQIAQIVTEGSNVTLECDAGINKTVSWRKVGQAKYPVGGTRKFAPVTLADGGLYHCVTEHARECAALATKTVNIQVNSIGSVPPNITTSFKNMIFKENATVRLTCQATGNPAPDVYWTKDRRRIGGSNTLELKASADNMGVYECVAANGAAPDAKASVTLELHVPALCPSDFCSNDGKCISSDSCDKNGSCADRRTSFECECKLGWSRPQCKKIDEVDMVFVGSFKLSGIAWREGYANSATESYKNITAEIRQAIDKAYENMPIFVRSKVLDLRKGSVIVDFELSFNEPTSRDKALEPLQNVAMTGSLGKYGINGSTITLQAASAGTYTQCIFTVTRLRDDVYLRFVWLAQIQVITH